MTHYHHRRTRYVRITACVAATAVSSIAYLESTAAQDEGLVTIDARRCLELQTPEQRLACFESQVDAAKGKDASAPPPAPAGAPAVNSQQPAPVGAPAPNAPQPPSGAQQSPPKSQQSTPTVDLSPAAGQSAQGDAPGQREWLGSITSLQTRAPNQYLITLESGQVWQQRIAERYPLRVGQRVRIYQSRFGFRLQADGVNGFIQVDRVP